MTPVKIGMMSFAHMHAFSYAAALKELDCVEFIGVADDDKDRAKKVGSDLGVESFAEYEDLLATDVQGIIVCSENIHHRRHVVVAAQHNKHVMCEKPLSVSNEDAEAMIEVCKRANVKLLTAFPCRFHPAFLQLKQSVDNGDLGKLLAIKATNQGKCPWGWFVDKSLSGGGAVIDHTVHVVDLMRCMSGSEPVRVYAEIDNRMHKKDFDDTGILTVEFANGLYATVDASWSRPKSYATWGNVKLDVVGTDGIAAMNMFAQQIDGFYDKSMSYTYDYWGENSDLNLVASFARCIGEDTPPEVTGEDGARALAVALAAYESAKTGKPVSLV